MMGEISFRCPRAEDGAAIWSLVGELDGLEQNTCYAYVLLCSHFGSRSVIAEREGQRLGFVLGYRVPDRDDTAFVWQIGVHARARGLGLGKRLLSEMLSLPVYAGCTHLEATVAAGNGPSEALFRSFARDAKVAVETRAGFPGALFVGSHADERLFRIGPLPR